MSCLHCAGEVGVRQVLPDVVNQVGEGRVGQRAEGLVHSPSLAKENVLRNLG